MRLPFAVAAKIATPFLHPDSSVTMFSPVVTDGPCCLACCILMCGPMTESCAATWPSQGMLGDLRIIVTVCVHDVHLSSLLVHA